MPVITEMLEALIGKKISRRCEPHCAAALGAVLAGRIEYQKQGKKYTCGDVVLPAPNLIVHDILSHSIGVMALDRDNKEICSEILPKDTPIPSIQTKLFKLSEPNQTAVTIKVLQGDDGSHAADCQELGHFELIDLPPRPDLIGRIEVTFSLDVNGLLTAKARDNASGKTEEMEINYDTKSNAVGILDKKSLLLFDFNSHNNRHLANSGGWIRTNDLRVMSSSIANVSPY